MATKLKITLGQPAEDEDYSDEDEDGFNRVNVEKIDNGFLVCAYGTGPGSEESRVFAENFMKVPTIMARLMKIENKNASEIMRDTKSDYVKGFAPKK